MAAIKGNAQIITIPRSSGVRQQLDAAFRGKAKGASRALGEEDTLSVLYATNRVLDPPFDMDQFADFYERGDVMAACIDHIVANVVGMGHEIVSKLRPRSGSDITPAETENEDPPDAKERERLAGIFDEPNTEGLTTTEVLTRWLTDVLSLGNGDIEITRDGSGQIDGLHHLPARTMRIRLGKDGKVENYVQVVGQKTQFYRKFGDTDRRFAKFAPVKATEDCTDRQRTFIEKANLRVPDSGKYKSEVTPPEAGRQSLSELTEVYHARDYSPRRGVYGMPRAAGVFEDMVGLAAYKLYNADFFENGTIPPALIIVRGGILADNTRDDIKSYLETEGRQEYHKIAILSADEDTQIEIHKLASELQGDASYLGYAEQCQKNIALRFRVPYSQLTESARRAPGQAEQDAIRFREQVVRPLQRWICGVINGLFFRDMGIKDWEFKLLEGDLTEMTARATACEKGLRGGALKPNEYRSIVHELPPMEGGNVASKTVPGVGIVPTQFVEALVEEYEREGVPLPELIRLQTPGPTNNNGGPAKVREAADKAGVDLDDDDIQAIGEELDS